jgi:SPP1 family predicted phage head-tail adaptor
MRVVFERATVAQDAFGEPDQTWATLATRWALVQPMKGAERFAANQVQADVDHRIVCRFDSTLSDLSPGDRATWDGHTYDIKSVIVRDHTRKEVEILAQEHVT